MQQLNYIGTRDVQWRDIAAPSLPGTDGALVRPLVVSTCDMDGAVIQGIVPLKGPVPLGHEGVGEVLETGPDVKHLKPGDRVIMPWKIACGHCTHCGRGHTAQCVSVPREDAYGWGPTSPDWGGFLQDVVAVPWADAMLTALPQGMDPIKASGLGDNIPDGYRAIAPHLMDRPGADVLVCGGTAPGSIGLFAVGFAKALGAGRVVYADHDATRLAIAESYGAEIWELTDTWLDGIRERFDITVDASGRPATLVELLRMTGRAGVCTSTSAVVYIGGDVPVPMFHMYRNSITLHTGWVHTHTILKEPMALIQSGAFDPTPVTSRVVSWEDAADALVEPFTKLIVSRAG